jgi:hypothetical protein
MGQKIYYLEVEETPVEDYWMAVHSPVEAHQIAFYVNQHSSILLKRSKKDLKNLRKQGPFLLFEWEDFYSDTKCWLLSNKTIEEKSSPLSKNDTLFELPERNEVSLFTEFKQADFFIKSTDNTLLATLQNQLKKWPLTSMCYRISLEKIRSQSNQILD